MTVVAPWQLRAGLARALSDMYGREVPAYATLLDVAGEVNRDVLSARGAAAERLGSIERVTAERHGAIRVGTPGELAQVALVFAAAGMHPVGFYDLRDAAPAAVPVVSTAFRPIDPDELARNPFRVFTSVLTTSDRRFFTADLQARLDAFLARRSLFPPALLGLAERCVADGGLGPDDAAQYLRLATASFELSPEPVDRAWYRELEAVSAVAADIGGVRSTHINHLTPRVLDIDELYRRMGRRGITMIDEIQGPPRWEGPDVLLRQTSFRALDEPRTFRQPDGSLATGHLRVRFGEVEARGIALTRAGRERYDAMVLEVDRRVAAGEPRGSAAPAVWRERLPSSEAGLADAGLGYFTHRPAADRRTVVREPVVYEDFLPRSAAGIFQSNLAAAGSPEPTRRPEPAPGGGTEDADWIAGALQRPWFDPFDLYDQQVTLSLARAQQAGVACSP